MIVFVATDIESKYVNIPKMFGAVKVRLMIFAGDHSRKNSAKQLIRHWIIYEKLHAVLPRQ